MRLAEVVRLLDAEVVSEEWAPDMEVTCGGAADLMSDVLSFTRPGAVLLTGLTNPQVIRTAEMAGVLAIVFVRGKHVQPEMELLAREAGIPLFRTSLNMFNSCGRLYEAGLRHSGSQPARAPSLG